MSGHADQRERKLASDVQEKVDPSNGIAYDDYTDEVTHVEQQLTCSKCGREEWNEGGTPTFQVLGWKKINGTIVCGPCLGVFPFTLERQGDGQVALIAVDWRSDRVVYTDPLESMFRVGWAACCAGRFARDHAGRLDPQLVGEFIGQWSTCEVKETQ